MPGHVQMCIANLPGSSSRWTRSSGFSRGKSARLFAKERNFTGEHFLARAYAESTVGFEVERGLHCNTAPLLRTETAERRLF